MGLRSRHPATQPRRATVARRGRRTTPIERLRRQRSRRRILRISRLPTHQGTRSGGVRRRRVRVRESVVDRSSSSVVARRRGTGPDSVESSRDGRISREQFVRPTDAPGKEAQLREVDERVGHRRLAGRSGGVSIRIVLQPSGQRTEKEPERDGEREAVESVPDVRRQQGHRDRECPAHERHFQSKVVPTMVRPLVFDDRGNGFRRELRQQIRRRIDGPISQ